MMLGRQMATTVSVADRTTRKQELRRLSATLVFTANMEVPLEATARAARRLRTGRLSWERPPVRILMSTPS